MKFDKLTTGGAFLVVIAAGIGSLLASNVMTPRVVFMMVLPSMLAFGLLALLLGIRHGEYRAAN
ncbi:hypothetical protein BRD17_06695 [Halobacteriales archaeon SW_7_68_16]|nr:MAG: hypothetical protein BRD17_06695 [Halobacteriales archaeon SW_7_68_16]